MICVFAVVRIEYKKTFSVVSETSDVASPICIIHTISTAATEPVLPFKDLQWQTVKNAAVNRAAKKNFLTSKYFTVVNSLPVKPNKNSGYHVKCYKNFTDVVKEPCKEPENITIHLRSAASPSSIPTEFNGIFPNACIFCEVGLLKHFAPVRQKALWAVSRRQQRC